MYLLSGLGMIMVAGMLLGCGNESAQPVETVVEEQAAPAIVEPVEISEAEITQLLARDIEHELVIKTHEVSVTDETNSETGKYDLMDKVNVDVSFVDEFGVLPQSINKDVYFMRNASSGQWEAGKENCKKWDARFKTLGGTAWKMTTEQGDIYLRLRDTIEFFTTQPDRRADVVDETQFSTTILGAIYMNEDGEDVLKRIHVISGKLSETGGIILHITYPHTDEPEIEINLNDFEKIEKEELPFSEEEYRAVADQF